MAESAPDRAVLRGHQAAVHAIAFSPDGDLLASASRDGTAIVWDARSLEQRARLRGHHGEVLGVSFMPDGNSLATVSEDTTAALWDLETGLRTNMLLSTKPQLCLAPSPDGAHLVTGGYDHAATIWDAATGKDVARIRVGGIVLGLAFSPDGTKLAICRGKDCEIWDFDGRKKVSSFGPHASSTAAPGTTSRWSSSRAARWRTCSTGAARSGSPPRSASRDRSLQA